MVTSILVKTQDMIVFKHELYRRTIEGFLSPLTQIAYNKKVLDWFLESDDQRRAIGRIVHHAKNAAMAYSNMSQLNMLTDQQW